MNHSNIAIFGYGGHAKEVACQINRPCSFFVDDEYVTPETIPISHFDPYKYEIIVAISDSHVRHKVVSKLPQDTRYFTFIHPTTLLLSKNIEIGEGTFIGPNCILTTNIKLGKHCILNRGNQIGHDVFIDDFFSAMPNVIISGNVHIGKRVYFGTNSCTKEKINIHDDVIIGLNSGVVKNIESSGVYVGTPSKKIK